MRLNDFSGPIKNDGTVLPDKYVSDDPGHCTSGSTVRMTRFLVIDDSQMEKVEYELEAPVIIYRRGQREFLPSDKGSFLESDPGGFYLEPGMIHNGNEFGEPRTLYEWSVVNMKYQPN